MAADKAYPKTRLSETLVPIISWDLLNIENTSDELVEDYFGQKEACCRRV